MVLDQGLFQQDLNCAREKCQVCLVIWNIFVVILHLSLTDIIKEGWAEKESGQKIFGQNNWRKRWFQLTKKGHLIVFAYYV